jgi:23S rRNA (uracil1939-C5)-methyltransferase
VDPKTPNEVDSARERETAILDLGAFDSHGMTRARFRGQSVEVEHGIPGERVRAEILGGRRRRARILEVLSPAIERAEAPCIYFREWACGGCQWQHIAYDSQLDFKRVAVNDEMRRAGLQLEVSAAHYLENPWRYRSTAGISLGKSAGFRRHGSLAIVPIHDCPISHLLIGRLMAALNEALSAGALPNFRGRVRLEVRVAGPTEHASHLHVLIRPDREYRIAAGDLASLSDVVQALEIVASLAVTRPGGSVEPVAGEPLAPTMIAGRRVWLASPSFFQTNQRLLPELITRLHEEAQPNAGLRIADAYAGVGIFGLFLAAEGADVTIVETDRVAIQAARRTAEEWGLSSVSFRQSPAAEVLAAEETYDAVIVDPPRAGLDVATLTAIRDTRPPLVLYVSCLAESLARDLRFLEEAGYRAEQLELFDFYPQTYHVELLAVLRPSSAA